jgi:hypothetical protein
MSVRVEDKIDERTLRIEFFMEPVAERADAFHLGDSPIGMGNARGVSGRLERPDSIVRRLFGSPIGRRTRALAREHSEVAIIMLITQCNGPKRISCAIMFWAISPYYTFRLPPMVTCLHGGPWPKFGFPRNYALLKRIVMGRMLIVGEKSLEDRVRTAVFDADQLESLMAAAFELLGKPEAQAQELARSILRAAERPQSGDPGSQERGPRQRRV